MHFFPVHQRYRFARTGTGNLSTRPVCTRKIASIFTEQVLKLAGRERTERVIVVGREHIELLIQLAQLGFVDVTCRDALRGPNAGEMAADIMVAPAVNREPKWTALLSRLERGLRPNGVLLLGIAGAGLTIQARHIRRFLLQRGFALVPVHPGRADLHVLCCRKVPALQSQAA